MARMRFVGVILFGLALVTSACGGISFDAAATALAPTPIPPPGTLAIAGTPVAITPGAQMAGVIYRNNEEHRFQFDAEAGEAVTVNMEAAPGGALDSYLELLGPDGSSVAVDDDSGDGINSRIDNFVLPESGQYTILARGFDRSSTGGFTLRMSLGTPVPSPTPPPTLMPGGGPISVGDIESGAINGPGQVDVWELAANRDDLITIDLIAGATGYLDPYMELIGPSGAVLRVDDDGGENYNAQIANFRIPADGVYLIRTMGLNNSIGTYELVIGQGEPPTPTPIPPTAGPSPTPYLQPIELGVPVSHELRPNTGGDRYVLTIDEPVVVEVLMEAQDERFNLYLGINEPVGGDRMLVDYSSAASVVYLPSVFLRMRGEYVFRVLAVESRFINYTLLLNPVEAANTGGQIEYGQGVSGALQFPSQEDLWTFEGRGGDIVTIVMNGVELDSYLELLDINGARIASNDDMRGGFSRDARIQNFRLPFDGTYTIVAASFRGNTTGPYRLMLFKENE